MKRIIVFGAGEFGALIHNIAYNLKDLEITAYGDDLLCKTKKTMLVKSPF